MTATREAISTLLKNIDSKFTGEKIIVLGKGPSIDKLPKTFFEDAIVIGLNDSEWIYPPHIAIFREAWVLESISASGFRSDLYITNQETPTGVPRLGLDFLPLRDDSADLMMARLLSEDETVIEEVLLLTALKVARVISDLREVKTQVFLLGLDFDATAGYARDANLKFDPKLDTARASSIEMQKEFLRNSIYMLRETNLEIVHVGDFDFSRARTSELKPKETLEGNIGQSAVTEVLVTAEITTNHFGDRARLETLIRKAYEAGADYVKFQKRDVETFYTAKQLGSAYSSPFGDTFGEYRHALELTYEDFEFISDLSASLGIGWFLSVLDEPSFHFIKSLKPEMIKLPSTISEHKGYLQLVAENYRGPLVLSTGMTDQDYESWILETFNAQERLYLLHANSAYPTPEAHCNIAVVRRYSQLAERYPFIVPGWSSHDPGWMGSVLAVAAGAGMVEKHVKLGDTSWAHFDAVAVDVENGDFAEYVSQIRRAQIIMGSSEKRITSSEHHKYRLTQETKE